MSSVIMLTMMIVGHILCRSACFGAKVWKVADPWDTCLVPVDLAGVMVGGGDCPHAGPLLDLNITNCFFLNNFSYSDSAAVAGCIATLIRGIVDGDGDACDTSEEIALLAEAGKMIS